MTGDDENMTGGHVDVTEKRPFTLGDDQNMTGAGGVMPRDEEID
jgi:hypothetical protein